MIRKRTPQEAGKPELKEVNQAHLNSQSSRPLFEAVVWPLHSSCADSLLCDRFRGSEHRRWHMQYTCTKSLQQFIVFLISRRLSASLTAKSESNLYPSSRPPPVHIPSCDREALSWRGRRFSAKQLICESLCQFT